MRENFSDTLQKSLFYLILEIVEKVWGVLFEPCQKTICPCLGGVLRGLVLPTAMLEGRFWCFVAVLQGTRNLITKISNNQISMLLPSSRES